jgi:hypothetical protein
MISVLATACTPAAPAAPTVDTTPLDIPHLDGGGAPRREGTRFAHPTAALGARWHLSVRADSSWTDAQQRPQRSVYSSEVDLDVLATNGAAASRVRVVFVTNRSSYQGLDTPTSIDGKSYIVDVGEPRVSSAAGGSVSEDEAQRVLDVLPDLGTRGPVDEAMPDEPLAAGDACDGLAVALARLMHPRAWRAENAHASFVRSESGVGVFAVSLVAVSNLQPIRMDLRGEATVRIGDSRLASAHLEGTYDVEDAGAPGAFVYERRVSAR